MLLDENEKDFIELKSKKHVYDKKYGIWTRKRAIIDFASLEDVMALWFRWISFDYRVTLGFGSIASGLDHVNPVIRLPIEHGISRFNYDSEDMELDEEAGYTTDEESVMSEHEAIDPVHAVNTQCVEEELNASNNVMPRSIYEYLKLANLRGSTMSVKMDDMTQQETLGTMKYILVKIDKFEFPCDFIVTDMPENLGEMIILGRPFLETIHAQIDVFQKEISLGIGEDRIKFDINGNPRQSNVTIKKVYMTNTSQEQESFNPLEIGHYLFSYESSACLQFEQDTRNYEAIDPQNEIVGQTNPLLDKRGLIKIWHVCKLVQVFYNNKSGEDYGIWPTCDPNSSFCYGYKEVFRKSEH
ncbi:reverse transcriptase domain-containing protein [Tanacetum coccineum]